MIMTIHNQAHTRQTAVHLIIQVAVMEAAVIHQKAILPENTIVVVHQEAVQILQAAAPVQINIIMIHTMMVMMMSIWMETMMMRTGKIVGGVLICHRMDTVEMKAFHMMENREDAAVARAIAGMIMMEKSKEGGQSGTI
jgi:hypothetical protein